jgi:hypothetical protein
MKQLNFNKLDDFYTISCETVAHHGGNGLLENVFDGFLGVALKSVYTNHKWLFWKFKQNLPPGFWDFEQNQREYME